MLDYCELIPWRRDEFRFELLSSINPDENYYLNEAGYWDPEVYDHYRWEIAKRIERLHEP